jgi:hypothetical protein
MRSNQTCAFIESATNTHKKNESLTKSLSSMSVDKQKGPKSESRVISRYDFDTISEGSKRVSKTCVQMAVCDIREGYSPVET